jgi:hypothetical protein
VKGRRTFFLKVTVLANLTPMLGAYKNGDRRWVTLQNNQHCETAEGWMSWGDWRWRMRELAPMAYKSHGHERMVWRSDLGTQSRSPLVASNFSGMGNKSPAG